VDDFQTSRSFQVACDIMSDDYEQKTRDRLTVDDHDFLGRFLFGELVENSIDSVTEHHSISTDLFGRTNIENRVRGRLDVVINTRAKVVREPAGLKVVHSGFDGYNIVTVRRTLNVGDAWAILFITSQIRVYVRSQHTWSHYSLKSDRYRLMSFLL
jgi:hypothetical protein